MAGTAKKKSIATKPRKAAKPAGKAKAVPVRKAAKPAKPGKPARATTPAKAARPVAAAKSPKAALVSGKPSKAPAPSPRAVAAAKGAKAAAAGGAVKGAAVPAAPGAKAPAAAGAPVRKPRANGGSKALLPPMLPSGVAPFPADALPGVLRYQEPLSKHTTFRIGGPAMVHFQPANVEAIVGALAWAKAHNLPWLVLGLGSNVLIRDGGFHGLVLKIGKGFDALQTRGRLWVAGAGLPTPLLARRAAEAGFEGIQRLIGVPGTVGGGVFMNAGAHGQDFATVLQSATVLTPKGDVAEKPRAAIPFAYRKSGLDGHVVLGCTLLLAEEPAEKVKADMNFVLKRRREGTPFDQPCCGSVFKNPADQTAGKLIEQCRLKGRRVGAAEISAVHANYIVNRGGASCDDVLKLIDIARTAVFKEFGIELELEVKVLGAPR